MKMPIEKSGKQSQHMRTSKTGKVYSVGQGAKKEKKKKGSVDKVKDLMNLHKYKGGEKITDSVIKDWISEAREDDPKVTAQEVAENIIEQYEQMDAIKYVG